MLHRVVGVGTLYFVLACVESYLRITRVKSDRSELLLSTIPLAVLDTVICWWIFTSLVQTTRTLRLRRNMVKLSLYRHFTNTLIFAVIASLVFMLFALRLRKTESCTPVSPTANFPLAMSIYLNFPGLAWYLAGYRLLAYTVLCSIAGHYDSLATHK